MLQVETDVLFSGVALAVALFVGTIYLVGNSALTADNLYAPDNLIVEFADFVGNAVDTDLGDFALHLAVLETVVSVVTAVVLIVACTVVAASGCRSDPPFETKSGNFGLPDL